MFGKLMHYVRHEDVNVLLGKTLTEIKNDDDVELLFRTDNNEFYKMYHEQDCCESVSIEEIIGDLDDLIGSPITMAEEIIQDGEQNDYESQTWTFYKFATIKGYVTIRWLGESNGYYSESVDFIRVELEKEDVKMPVMTYSDCVGEAYKFKKGERVPKWLLECEVAFFGTNVLVIPLKNQVYMFGKASESEPLIEVKNQKGEGCTQVCPQISFYTNQEIWVG